MKELNEELNIITWVVVHPKYRTIGLRTKLVKETLPLAGTSYVEMSAVMAKYNSFAEKAGVQKIANNHHQKKPKRLPKSYKNMSSIKWGFLETAISKSAMHKVPLADHCKLMKEI